MGFSSKYSYLISIYKFFASTSTKDSMPNDTTIKDVLMTEGIYRNRGACRLILSILENGINSLKEGVVIDENITIEHIMPQNKDNDDWKAEIGDYFDIIYEIYVNTLGNLTLTGCNSELSDKSFEDKKSFYKKSKFIVLNEDVVSKEHWGEEEIIARANRLSKKLLDELKLPDIFKSSSQLQSTIEKHTVDDGFDFTGKKFTSFIFLGESHTTKNGAEMLVSICELLYSLDSASFEELAKQNYSISSPQYPLLSYDFSLIRSPKEINNTGIFVETNKSANDIVRTIRKLLDKFSLSYDDLIIYC